MSLADSATADDAISEKLKKAAPMHDDQWELTFDDPPELTPPEKFESFHNANPGVYCVLVELTRQAQRSGRTKVGIKALFERARWELSIATDETAPKLNNDYTAYYARLIMRQEPDLAGIFEVRRSAADEILGAA